MLDYLKKLFSNMGITSRVYDPVEPIIDKQKGKSFFANPFGEDMSFMEVLENTPGVKQVIEFGQAIKSSGIRWMLYLFIFLFFSALIFFTFKTVLVRKLS